MTTKPLPDKYADLLPPLSTEEFEALKADIELNGIQTPIAVDEDGNILDGHHRYKIDPGAPYKVISGLTDTRKLAFVYRSNMSRRNLSAEQKKYVREKSKQVATDLKLEGCTESEIAAMLGVSRQTINSWLNITVASTGNGYIPKVGIKVPEQTWETVFKAAKTEGKTQEQIAADLGVTQPRVSKAFKKQEKKAKHKKNSKVLKEIESPPLIYRSSWDEWLPKQFDCDLLITDPPYMTDIEDIEEFAHQWLPVALSKVKPAGRAYVCVGSYPEELRAYLTADYSGMELANILAWTYRNTLGPAPKRDYKNNWQAVLYFVGPDAPDLDCPKMTEQFSVQDISAPDARTGTRYHAFQKPDELARRLISHSTKPGQLILDPFAGTGTFILMAAKMKRAAIGCDINDNMIQIAVKRGCNHGG